MTIIITNGCTAYSRTYDGVREEDLTPDQRNEILDKLIAHLRKSIELHHLRLEDVVDLFEPTKVEYGDEPCDQCGDTVSQTTYEI